MKNIDTLPYDPNYPIKIMKKPTKNRVAPPSSKGATNTSAVVVLKSIEREAAPIIKQLSKVTIIDNVTFDKAARYISDLKQLARKAQAEELTITAPLNAALKATKAHFRPFFDALAALETQTKLDMADFLKSRQIEQDKLEAAFKLGQIKRVSTAVRKQAELVVTSEHAQLRKIWQLTIVDATKIPRAYLVPDEVMIKEALKAGKSVPGCKMKQVDSIAI